MLQWLQRRRQAERLATADAEALIRDHGAEAYSEACQRERDMILPGGCSSGAMELGVLHGLALSAGLRQAFPCTAS